MSHTKEPWHTSANQMCIAEESGGTIAVVRMPRGIDEAEANARRIAACVNACAGIPIHDLETANTLSEATQKWIDETLADNATLRSALTTTNECNARLLQQRDELLAAARRAVWALAAAAESNANYSADYKALSEAITKATN